MESTDQKLVGLFCPAAKMHFHTLLTKGRNVIFIQFCTGILRSQTFQGPFDKDMIYREEGITIKQVFRKNIRNSCL